MGPGSWGWVERGCASTRGLERPGILENLRIPVLIVGTDHDQLVRWPAIARAARRMPCTTLHNYGKAAHHEVLREADPVRDRVLADADAFLARIAAGGRG